MLCASFSLHLWALRSSHFETCSVSLLFTHILSLWFLLFRVTTCLNWHGPSVIFKVQIRYLLLWETSYKFLLPTREMIRFFFVLILSIIHMSILTLLNLLQTLYLSLSPFWDWPSFVHYCPYICLYFGHMWPIVAVLWGNVTRKEISLSWASYSTFWKSSWMTVILSQHGENA